MALTGSVLKSERFVIAVQCASYDRNVFQVQFSGSDGSVFVCFPYFRHTTGLVSKATLPGGSLQATLELQIGGKVASHLVKYSHHPDGTVLFSQTGRVISSIRKVSVPLSSFEGHMFTVHAQGLPEFGMPKAKDLRDATPNRRRTRLSFRFPDITPASVKFVGRIHSLGATEEMVLGGVVQPTMHTMDADGTVGVTFVCAPPDGFPLQNHLLLLSCEALPALDQSRSSSLLFLGGFDPPAIVNDPDASTSVLAFSYPIPNAEELREQLGSIDFRPSWPRGAVEQGDAPDERR